MSHKQWKQWGKGNPNVGSSSVSEVRGPSHGRVEFKEPVVFAVPPHCVATGIPRHMKQRARQQATKYGKIALVRKKIYNILTGKRYSQATKERKTLALYKEALSLVGQAQAEVKAMRDAGGVPFEVPAHFLEKVKTP